MISMEILSWNCRGICNDSTVQALKTLIQQKRPSMIFLNETKVRDKEYMNRLWFRIGYINYEDVLSNGQFGGLALFWIDRLNVRFRSKSHQHVDLEIHATDGSSLCWRHTGFYGHSSTTERYRTSWDLLRQLGVESSLPWVVLEDFNELLHADEKLGGPPHTYAIVSRCIFV